MGEVPMAEKPTVRDPAIRVIHTVVQDLIKFSALVAGRKSSFKSLHRMIKNFSVWNAIQKNRDGSGGRSTSYGPLGALSSIER
jgi:hypothetical protein